jgi:hypothetical protein
LHFFLRCSKNIVFRKSFTGILSLVTFKIIAKELSLSDCHLRYTNACTFEQKLFYIRISK